jgi:hypothetical protein
MWEPAIDALRALRAVYIAVLGGVLIVVAGIVLAWWATRSDAADVPPVDEDDGPANPDRTP